MTRIARESAVVLACQRIDQLAEAVGEHLEILSEATMETEQGWVFFYNTADFVRTRNPSSCLAGNGPLLVTHQGLIYELPSAIPWEDALKQL